MSETRYQSLEEIRPENSGLKDFIKKDFENSLVNEIEKRKAQTTSDNTNYSQYLNLFLTRQNTELEEIFYLQPELVSNSELKALRIFNLLVQGKKISKSQIFPFLSPDLVLRKKLADKLAQELVNLYKLIENNTDFLKNESSELWSLVEELPEVFYHLSKYLIVKNKSNEFDKIKKEIKQKEQELTIQTSSEEPELVELYNLEKIKLHYLKILLASRNKDTELDHLLSEYHEIYKAQVNKESKLIAYGVETLYKPSEILKNWSLILEEANKIQEEIETLSCINPRTCEYFSCSDCCQFTFPTMSKTEFLYLKNWMKENKLDDQLIKEKANAIQEDYKTKYGEKLKILDKSKPENNLRGVENPYDYKFSCPFLSDDGKCSCHPARPLLCRGFGTATNNGISIKTCNFYLKQYQHNSSPENERYVFDLRPMEELVRLSDKFLFESGQSEIQEASGTIVAWFSG